MDLKIIKNNFKKKRISMATKSYKEYFYIIIFIDTIVIWKKKIIGKFQIWEKIIFQWYSNKFKNLIYKEYDKKKIEIFPYV